MRIRWDRWLLCTLLAAFVVGTNLSGLSGGAGFGPLRLVGLWVGVLLVLFGVFAMAADPERRHWRWRVPLALVGVVVYTLSAELGVAIWVAFLGVGWAAGATSRRTVAAALALPALAAVTYRLWGQTDPGTLLIALAALVLTFIVVHLRRLDREAAEFARAQDEVIRLERARAATADQRREVAAQVHDVLAHTLSGLIVTLQGATVLARREEVSDELRQRLADATSLAREGLAGARQAVQALHGDTSDDSAQPVADTEWLATMADRLRRSADLDLTVTGTLDQVPVRWRDLARSAVTEALTNALRHAPGAAVTVALTDHDLTVTSGPAARPVDPTHAGSGRGLAGLRSRVESAGGSFLAEPTGDGFQVQVRFA